MSLRCPKGSAAQPAMWVCARWLLIGATLLLMSVTWLPSLGEGGETQAERQLRVCADPNNLPYSDQQGEGFENRMAELIARELHATVQYTWWAQRRGFIRNTLNAGTCDVILGVPYHFELALTTSPYYRSTYVFVYRKDTGLTIRSFDDTLLRHLHIGVQLIGDDYANTPPAHALANRGIIDNVIGYTVYGDYTQANPTARIMEAVGAGEVDVAVVWGPFAGDFARRQSVPLDIVPVSPPMDPPSLPFVFDISIGVRKDDEAFKGELQAVLEQKRTEIEAILDEYDIPRVAPANPKPVP